MSEQGERVRVVRRVTYEGTEEQVKALLSKSALVGYISVPDHSPKSHSAALIHIEHVEGPQWSSDGLIWRGPRPKSAEVEHGNPDSK